jgi:alpha-ribazole phosphatase
MLELIFIRHGEINSNKKGTYCGWTDTELNEKGMEQAEAVAGRLLSLGIAPDRIYSSPLKRAVQTAEIISRNYGLEIHCNESLKERNFGVWEDLTYEDICSRYPEERLKWENDWVNFCITGGESAAQVFDRVNSFVLSLIDRHKSGRILLVTHLGCVQSVLAHFLGLPPEGFWRFRIENCGIARLLVNEEGYAYLTGLNL